MGLRSKAATLWWYAQRPTLYRELARKIVMRQFSTAESVEKAKQTKLDGQAWCEAQAKDPKDLLIALGQSEPTLPKLSELHPSVWSEAKRAVEACPVKMGGPANVEVLYQICRATRPRVVLETGVANGWSTLAILLALPEDAKLMSGDMPYAKMGNEDYVGCAVPESLRARWELIRKPDRDALPEMLRSAPEVDLLHYDSDKSYEGRTFAYQLIWPALRPGGVLMSDDIEDNFAFRDFSRSLGIEPWVLKKEKPGNYAGVLVKP